MESQNSRAEKKSKCSFPVRSTRTYFSGIYVHIEKVGKVKFKSDFIFPDGKDIKLYNPRVHLDNGKWILSFGFECENQTFELNDFSMGIDLGIKELAVVAYGDKSEVFHNINKSHRIRFLERKLKILQRKILRKYHMNKNGNVYIKTKNIERCENELRKLYAKISNIRQDYIHKTTRYLVNLRPRKVVMETLNVKGLMKNKHLSKSISNQKFYEFIRQMKYKCEWSGIEFIQADRFYPSSKTCSCCGYVKDKIGLKERVFRCKSCGNMLDRDLNAAKNLMRYEV